MKAFVTGRGLISPGGRTPDALATGFDTGLPGRTGAVSDFSGNASDGAARKGALDRGTALAAEAARAALADAGLEIAKLSAERLGIVLASHHASVALLAAAVTDSICPCPICLAAATNPINLRLPAPVGMCDIWYRMRSLTAKVSGGYLSGLLALRRALDEMEAGHAHTLLVGAGEELPAAARRGGGGNAATGKRAALTECGVCLVLEDESHARAGGRRSHAGEFRCHRDHQTADFAKGPPRRLVGRLTELFKKSGIKASDVSTVITSGLGHPLVDAYEAAAVEATFFRSRPNLLEVVPFIGNTMSGLNLVQTLAGLAYDEKHDIRGPVLVVSADPSGQVGAGLFARAA